MEPPPPPPPHGSNPSSGIPKSSGLPPGKYDIFIIPPHSAGSGFLYLPSLQPHRNSFLAGVFCTLLAVAIWTVIFPVLRDWFATIVASGGMGVVVLLMGVGVAGWAWGKTQMEAGGPADGGTGGASNAYTNANGNATGGPPPHAHPTGGMPGASTAPPPQPPPPPPPPPPQPEPQPSWQKPNPGPGFTAGATSGTRPAKTEWEKAREETRRKEEFRKRAEELRKKREEEEKAKARQREKDAKERELREQKEKEEKEKAEKEMKERQEKAEKEMKERQEKAEKEMKERLEKEVKEKVEKELAEKAKAEREARLKEARERRERQSSEAGTESRAAESRAGESSGAKKPEFLKPPHSPTKKHQQPSASTAADDESSYSYRPYDKPKRTVHKATSASSVYSESSYAPSQSTARTTPPPSQRGPYQTKDPDKIVIKAVYSFNNTFTKLPIAQLVSGAGAVTDGLILRITTEGLFIDDDVRGVPQREWDVKAWTLKLIETGEYRSLHVIRANVRDQEGKRYVFVLQDEENWKVAQGLQRLKRGTQVRSLGQSGMTANETKAILENMGWL